MNKFTIILMSGVAGILWLVSCGETMSPDFTPSKDRLTVNDVVMDGNASQTNLSIQANCNWTITENVDWLVIQPVQGSGDAEITLTTGVNPTSVNERSCQFTVSTPDGVSRTVNLSQSKSSESLSVAPSSLSFGEVGGTNSFTITSNTEWTVRGGAEWLSYSPNQGNGDGTVSIAVQTNNTEFVREVELTVSGKGSTVYTVRVTQAEKAVTLTIEPEKISATAIANDYSFKIQGNASWRITVDDNSWISFSQTEGSDEAEITAMLMDNPTGSPRTANVRVTSASGRIERTCAITQAAATLPSVTKVNVWGIGRYVASFGSDFSSPLGVTDYGFVWSTSANPTLEQCAGKVTGTSAELSFTPTATDGKNEVLTAGELSVTVNSFSSGVTYHVRAYARNAYGVGYSDDITFLTGGNLPDEDENKVPNL
ncbi:MAG: BACON domain-containing protein [Bacteroidaceae bacterium]|nr:BACON domain-containing protein [Bacteroidaceae bacterium]